MRMIDIFGDGEHIFDAENLPNEFTAKSGKWKKVEQKGGRPSYSLVEVSQEYIDNEIKPDKIRSAERKKRMEKEMRIVRKMREIAEREIEKEEEG